MIGARDVGAEQGAAYVFERGLHHPAIWTEVAKLTAAGGVDYDQFGISVAISGDTVVIGARPYVGPGAAYVFQR